MNHRLSLIAPLLMALATPAFTQDVTITPKVEAKKSQTPALVIKTNKHEIASGMAEGFEVQGEVPEAKDGQHYVISIDDGGKAKVVIADGKAGYMEVHAKPGPLMEIFADKIEQARGMAQGFGTMALQQAGMKTKDAVRFIQSVFDFPKQIESFEMNIASDPEHAKKDGMDIDMQMTAVAGTGFAEFVAAMRPNGLGAPQVGSGGGMMSMTAGLDGKGLAKAVMPLMSFITPMVAKTEEDSKKFSALTEKMLGLTDGSLGMEMVGDGMHFVLGLTDGKTYQELMTSPEYKAFAKLGTPAAEVEVTDKAFEHRSVSVTKSVVKPKEGSELPPNPLFGDGPVETFSAVAGNYMVMTMGGGKDQAIKGLIDNALDQKVKRTPLAGGALMIIALDMGKLSEKMGGQAEEDAPETMTMSLTRTTTGLGFKIHAK